MKKSILFLACALYTVTSIFAQQKIAVQSGSQTKLYDSLTVAIREAASGDVLYLPGTLIEVPADIVIDKKLSIIGAGWDIDSIGGLLPTVINKNIKFISASNGSLVTGCDIPNIFILDSCREITISRNKIQEIQMSQYAKAINISENFITFRIIGENSIGPSDCIIFNNFFSYTNWNLNHDVIWYIRNSIVSNNVTCLTMGSLNNCIIQNNYFRINSKSAYSNSTFNNNALMPELGDWNSEELEAKNNILMQSPENTFTTVNWSHSKYFTIKADSPCKNAGTDGTDIGIYGGSSPYKAGAKPFTPHIDKMIISNATNSEGGLKVDIKVSAQER